MPPTTTWDDVAAEIKVDVRTLHRWRKIAGSPESPDVEQWAEWMATRKGAKLADRTSDASVSADADLPGECDYDALVKAGKITYALAKTREQVVEQKLANETRRVELAKARGALVTKEDAERAASLIRDDITNRYERAIARGLAAVADRLSAELRADVSKAISHALDLE